MDIWGLKYKKQQVLVEFSQGREVKWEVLMDLFLVLNLEMDSSKNT